MIAPEVFISGFSKRPEDPRILRAGPLTVGFAQGELRNFRYGGREIINRVYGAVRGVNWSTCVSILSELQIVDDKDSFEVQFLATHQREDVHFSWQGQITGDSKGTIRFEFDGRALTTFIRNRIGICLLHPMSVAGARCQIEYANGTVVEASFPKTIAREQPLNGFTDIAAITQDIASGLRLEASFTGDLFETEDQRNWTDASFKTYSTPLRLPRPVEIKAGTRVHQTVTLRLIYQHGLAEPAAERSGGSVRIREHYGDLNSAATDPIEIKIDRSSPKSLPTIGLAVHDFDAVPVSDLLSRIEQLRLSHLRVETHLGHHGSVVRAQRKLAMARELSLPVELMVYIPADAQQLGAEFAELVAGHRLCRLLAIQDGYPTTTARALEMVRSSRLNSEVQIGAGTASDLAKLTLFPPETDGADYIAWSMNPQFHVYDNFSLVETPAAAREQVLSIHQYYPGLPLVVSPITLKPRAPIVEAENDRRLLTEFDPRQQSLIVAAWTLAMFKSLAENGTDAMTFFETAGCLGVMEDTNEDPRFVPRPPRPQPVFPLYHVFAAVAGFTRCFPAISTSPGVVEALALQDANGGERLVIANLSTATAQIQSADLSSATSIRRLDELTVMNAMERPTDFWQPAFAAGPRSDKLELGPYALGIVDLT